MAERWTAAQMPSLAGKSILVTGANSGIGYRAALEFARHGAHVVAACRSQEKADNTAERLRREAAGASVDAAVIDLASLQSVRTFAEGFAAAGAPLDVLVNNAGVMALPSRQLTEDGFERQFGTNHLGHFALTGLLMPVLRKAERSRVVTIASLAHRNGKMEWNNLQGELNYVPWNAYNASRSVGAHV